MIKIEEEERNRIERVKEDERKKATEEIEKFKDFHKSIIDKEVLTNELEKEVVIENIKEEIINSNKDIFDNLSEIKKVKSEKVEG
jgi:hypothetical protein